MQSVPRAHHCRCLRLLFIPFTFHLSTAQVAARSILIMSYTRSRSRSSSGLHVGLVSYGLGPARDELSSRDDDSHNDNHQHHKSGQGHKGKGNRSKDMATASATASTAATASAGGHSLSLGATAAIAVILSFLGVSAIIWGLFFFLRRRRKRTRTRRTQAVMQLPSSPFLPAPALRVTEPTTAGSSVPFFVPAHEADALHAREWQGSSPFVQARSRDGPSTNSFTHSLDRENPDPPALSAPLRARTEEASPFAPPRVLRLTHEEAKQIVVPGPPRVQYVPTSYTLSV